MADKQKNDTFEQVLTKRVSRRTALKGLAGSSPFIASISTATLLGTNGCSSYAPQKAPSSPLNFTELPHGYDDTHHVAKGYQADVLIRWGDPMLPGAPNDFRGGANSAESQLQQFGYNNDFIGFHPLPFGSNNSDHGLLCVNHEYCTSRLMFPFSNNKDANRTSMKKPAEIEMAAHGHSVIEIKKIDGQWQVVPDSKYNRRITPHTEMNITGPAAGHRRLQTNADPSGRKVYGTLSNCAGGVTPWGTTLIAEENFNSYFTGDRGIADKQTPDEQRNYQAYNVGGSWYSWSEFHDRFNIEKEPREFNRFGWMVEFDPYNPTSTPKKRTALGRFCHEGATIVAVHGKQVVAYSGDDGSNQCIYRFVSRGVYNKDSRTDNMDLLAEGDLYAAKFHANGVGEWLKIELSESDSVQLQDPVEALIETRHVAHALGATPMDRPEDIETNPITGRTYVMLTNNHNRDEDTVDATNPRANNKWGQIVEILPPGTDGNRDHLAPHFQWEMFLLAGDPYHPDDSKRGRYNRNISQHGWFSNPDNVAFDPQGRMWIATDGFPSNKTPEGVDAPVHDGIWACDTIGEQRALTRHFFGCPMGAEVCGPCFTPDGTTLFASIQHPGDVPGSDYNAPATRWPDFDPDNPPRPSVIAITKVDGGKIGS